MRNRSIVARGVLAALPALGLLACVSDYSPGYAEDLLADAAVSSVDAGPEVPATNARLGHDLGCDLSGRWITTERRYISVMGTKQVAWSWFYVELSQQGEQVTMTRGINCGEATWGAPLVELRIDDSEVWPVLMEKVRYDGRRGSAKDDGERCQVVFDKAVVVRGATVAAYRDLSVPMPKLDQPAGGSTPGWEDWDEDGHPGITMRFSGSVHDAVYEASRTWTSYSGSVERDVGSFTLSHLWEQERVTLGYGESPFVVYQGVRDPDESQQIVEFTRLMPEQALGDDAARCRDIRDLAAMLTPHASSQTVR